MATLAKILDQMTVEGELYERLPDSSLRCYACGHRCLIRPGKRGICQVRYNDNGKLRVPWGYVAALQADPIEKKPFFHVLTGSDALTFGMLGCDFHCGYCFTGDTIVLTQNGPVELAQAFRRAERREDRPGAQVAWPANLQTVTASGALQQVQAIFSHPYQGQIIELQPFYLRPLRCTLDHRVFATADPSTEPGLVRASQLRPGDYLAVPRRLFAGQPQMIDVALELNDFEISYWAGWDLSLEARHYISTATSQGQTSREIGRVLGKDPSYIRHVRSKQARGLGEDTRVGTAMLEEHCVRFPNEHRPGIPAEIPLDKPLARLLGFYCAEGSLVKSTKRPNSHALNFSFGLAETDLVEEVSQLLQTCLNLHGRQVRRDTTLAVTVTKASAAMLFKKLCGSGAQHKHIPPQIFCAQEDVVRAFMSALVTGDGHRNANGKVSLTTVSSELAYGAAALALRLGYLPSIYDTQFDSSASILGRKVKRAPHQYTVVWYETGQVERRLQQTGAFFLVPLRAVNTREYQGDVYNMQVENEHNYLAGLFAVSNCQNWYTSQALRDPASDLAVEFVRKITPEQMVQTALHSGAKVIASSYNEPLITAEWAAGIFKPAQQAGLKCVFISNGNATPEALRYLRPYLCAYKIDLKTMQDKHYRQLGGVLQNVLDSIRLAHELGLWVEVVTLVVPGFNDSTEELMDAARFITSVSPDIPWHVTAFHPDYKMTDPPPTSVSTLVRAAEIGEEAGLNFVYAGNIPGRTKGYENTCCPKCRAILIERTGYTIQNYHITAKGTCSKCGADIPGVWTDQPETVNLGGWGMPRRVRF